MRMPVLADIKKTQQELTLALAELDSIEAAVVAQSSSQTPPDSSQLRERVQFLQQENRVLAQVSLTLSHWYTATLSHCHTVTPSHWYTVTLSQCHSVTMA